MLDFLSYVGRLLLLTLGTVTLCGLAVELCSRAFIRLSRNNSDTVFDITAVIGTPVHELGHAAMCLLFAHRIVKVKLWSPRAKNGVYGYVEHSYNRRNPWAVLGNLLIGTGPIFSGLCVIALTLRLCFAPAWGSYIAQTNVLLSSADASVGDLFGGIFSLLLSLPAAIASHPIRSILGLILMLSVSLHVSLSWQDIRSALSALPLYALTVLLFGGITYLAGVAEGVTHGLALFHLRLLSLFGLVIAFALLWVILALLIRLIRIVIGWF